jgi:LuxR family maltose regulon positive regulatory protein
VISEARRRDRGPDRRAGRAGPSTAPARASAGELLGARELEPPGSELPGGDELQQAIPRRRLLRPLQSTTGARIAVLTAPPGSGKTTLFRQWAADDPRPACWVPLSPAESDPNALVRGIAEAIATMLPGGPIGRLAEAAATDQEADVSSLIRGITLDGRPLLLLLDDLHGLDDPDAYRLVARLAEALPPSWSLGLASREVVSLPTARWRLRGSVVELGPADLAFDGPECDAALALLGVRPSPDVVAAIHARTEGWPAGVRLAGLALLASAGELEGSDVAGDIDGIRSYLETELLAGMDAETHGLLVQTSVVDAVSGPLADAITGRTGSAGRLYALSRANQMVIPLDSQRRWFRYHRLLRDVLVRELEDSRRDPTEVQRRAAAWYAAEGRFTEAIDLALQGQDHHLACRLVLASLPAAYREGRGADVTRWIQALDPEVLAGEPVLATSAALVAALEGDPLAATHWAAIAERGVPEAPASAARRVLDAGTAPGPRAPDAATPGGAPDAATPGRAADAALLRAVLCRDGPEAMRSDAERSLAAHDPDWPWRPLALLAAGAARDMLGDPAGAAERYLEAEQSPETAADVVRLALRAERALEAIGRRRWVEVQAILGLDRSAVLADADAHAAGIGGGIAAVLWLVADARLAVHRGDLRTAEERLCRAEPGRRRLSWAIPWLGVRTLTELARAWLLLGNAPMAMADLAAAREIVRARPGLGTLAATADELLRLGSRASNPGLPGTSSLTPAELRLLPFLQTYLTLKQIGERLGVSGNTVKTEAVSIYAKLGAGSRSEAVTSAVTHGLLEDIFA